MIDPRMLKTTSRFVQDGSQIFNTSNRGSIQSDAIPFVTAADGTGVLNPSTPHQPDTGVWLAGGHWFPWQGFIEFNTAAIPASAYIAAARLEVDVLVKYVTSLFQFIVAPFDFGAVPIAAADWRNIAALQALPELIAVNSFDMPNTGQSGSYAIANKQWINKGGLTRLVTFVSANRSGIQPPVAEEGFDITDIRLNITWGHWE